MIWLMMTLYRVGEAMLSFQPGIGVPVCCRLEISPDCRVGIYLLWGQKICFLVYRLSDLNYQNFVVLFLGEHRALFHHLLRLVTQLLRSIAVQQLVLCFSHISRDRYNIFLEAEYFQIGYWLADPI